jgi:hypothetical protein
MPAAADVGSARCRQPPREAGTFVFIIREDIAYYEQNSIMPCLLASADVDVIQNGIWLTVLLGLDRASLLRSVGRCEEIALAP